ncbi:8910_t:CDS:1 [Ambispora gerdemannii]|uniref:8910_t:CDS:1 n=1 Tax=Ambispora gerdemannii TaxID=144530 RepID=A0A9N8VMX9_9GLOM|nr:8910_t:CDS:1 [Ambispora gerdemannii]
MYTNVKQEEGTPNNATSNFYRPPGLYNLVSAAEVVGGTTSQSGSPQLIGQKRGFDGEDNDDYNNNSNQPNPPLAMHPPPLNNIAVATTMNVANSFPSPLNVSPQSSPGSSAFQGWNHPGKRVKYEYPEATTPSSAHSSPRIAPGYQLPGLGAGPSTPGSATTPTQQYTNSSLQMVTNAQGSPHHYSSSSGNNNGPATGTTTPTTEGLERYFQDSTALTTSSPESGGVGTPVEESNRRYDQY